MKFVRTSAVVVLTQLFVGCTVPDVSDDKLKKVVEKNPLLHREVVQLCEQFRYASGIHLSDGEIRIYFFGGYEERVEVEAIEAVKSLFARTESSGLSCYRQRITSNIELTGVGLDFSVRRFGSDVLQKGLFVNISLPETKLAEMLKARSLREIGDPHWFISE